MELRKTSQLDELIEFIKGKRDSRELKRAIAVKLVLEEYTYPKIQSILNVSSGFISKWKTAFLSQGIEGLLLKYKGAKPLLNSQEKQTIIEGLKQKDYWDLQELYVKKKRGNHDKISSLARKNYSEQSDSIQRR